MFDAMITLKAELKGQKTGDIEKNNVKNQKHEIPIMAPATDQNHSRGAYQSEVRPLYTEAPSVMLYL